MSAAQPAFSSAESANNSSEAFEHEMDMIGHQTVRIQLNVIDGFPLAKYIKVVLEIVGFREHHLPMVSSLNDMMGIVGVRNGNRARPRRLPCEPASAPWSLSLRGGVSYQLSMRSNFLYNFRPSIQYSDDILNIMAH